jgi:hypothetical protein
LIEDRAGGFVLCKKAFSDYLPRKGALPHEKSAIGLFTQPPTIEVFSNSSTRSPLRSFSFAKRTEVAIMRSLRQIFHEATGVVAVVLAERFRVGPFQGRQRWEKE